MKTFICLAVVSLACACGKELPLSEQLTANIESWGTDFNSHDVAAVLTHYTDDARFIYTFDGQEGQGRDALRAFYTASFMATPDITVKRTSYDVVQVSDTIAFGMGEFEDTFTGPMGSMTAPTHASEIWVKQNGVWSVLVDHASFVPPASP